MDCNQILAAYEDIACLTHQMLVAARAGDWDRMVILEKECAAHFALLLAGNTEAPHDDGYLQRKAGLIRRILDDDAQIRLLVEPWLEKLSTLIGSTRQQSRLHQTYGATP